MAARVVILPLRSIGLIIKSEFRILKPQLSTTLIPLKFLGQLDPIATLKSLCRLGASKVVNQIPPLFFPILHLT